MDRSLADLTEEARSLGLSVPAGSKKDDIEIILRDFYWRRDHPGEQMLLQVDPMLAEKLRDLDEEKQARIWADKNWGAQLKLNGCRLLFHIIKGRNRFTTRGKSVQDFLFGEATDNLPYHRDLQLLDVLDGTVLDGEIVSPYAVADTGKIVTRKALAVATAILNSAPEIATEIQKKYGPMEYHAFDIVRFKGMDVRLYPYSKRLEFLKQVEFEYNKVFPRLPVKTDWHPLKFPQVVVDNKQEYYNEVVAAGEEGVVLKDLRAPYQEGKRSSSLLKVKRFEELDAFVVGFKPGKEGKKNEAAVGSLLMAVIDKATGKQTIIGCVAKMTDEFRKYATVPVPHPMAVPSDEEFVYAPFAKYPIQKAKVKERVINYQLNPELLGKVAVIQGQEFTVRKVRFIHCTFPVAYTEDGKFNPWRTDKRPEDCIEDVKAIAEKAGAVAELEAA